LRRLITENFEKEETPMADKKKQGKHHDQETIKPGKAKKDEISDKDLEKASGGGFTSPRTGGAA
jgi:hypothetical protein